MNFYKSIGFDQDLNLVHKFIKDGKEYIKKEYFNFFIIKIDNNSKLDLKMFIEFIKNTELESGTDYILRKLKGFNNNNFYLLIALFKPIAKEQLMNLVKLQELQGISNKDYFDKQSLFTILKYPNEIKFDKKFFNIYNFDIEVYSEKEFPQPNEAKYPVSMISIQNFLSRNVMCLVLKTDNKVDEDYIRSKYNFNIDFVYFDDELKLIKTFEKIISNGDILTGWNIDEFDIPYLYNRLKNLNSDSNIFYIDVKNQVASKITSWDYMQVYKRVYRTSSSYSLNYISNKELNTGKLDYSEFKSISEFYKKDFSKFIEYNIKDVDLIYNLDKKLHLFDLFLHLVYSSKSHFNAIFGTIKMWDNEMCSFLLNNLKILPPPKINRSQSSTSFIGGYVKEPKTGKFKNIVVLDIVSSYPNQIISYNLSGDTLVTHLVEKDIKPIFDKLGFHSREELEQLRKKDYTKYEKYLEKNILKLTDKDILSQLKPISEKYNITIAPNMNFYTKEFDGINAVYIGKIFNERIQYKKIKSLVHKLLSNMNDLHLIGEIKKLLNEYSIEYDPNIFTNKKLLTQFYNYVDLIQSVLKIKINSFYGALANKAFRFFKTEIAESVTTLGQVAVRGAERYVEENGFDVNYIDTDSLNIILNNEKFKNAKDENELVDIAKKEVDIILPIIKDYINTLTSSIAKKNTINFDFELYADVGYFVAKKKYIYRKIYEDGTIYKKSQYKLKVKNMNSMKASTPDFLKNELNEIIKMIIDDQSILKIKNEIKNFFESYKKMPLEDISSIFNVNGLSKYQEKFDVLIGDKKIQSKITRAGIPIHVLGSLVFNKLIDIYKLNVPKIENGDKVNYIYTIPSRSIYNTHVISFKDYIPPELLNYILIDYKTQFEKTFLNSLDDFKLDLNIFNDKSIDDLF